MAHGKRAGAISDILAPGPPLHPGPGVPAQGEEVQRRPVGEAPEPTPRASIDGDNGRLTPPVPPNQYCAGREPNPEDMEDTCSEYDNVGSDVEQDCDGASHLSREAAMDARYYKQVGPEEAAYAKRSAGDGVREISRAADRHAPRSRHGAETFKGLQSGSKPHKAGHSFRPYRAPSARDGAQRGGEKGHENRFLLSDGDEVEEVLDGARFIEDLEKAEGGVPTQTRLCQDNERERIRKRGDDARVTRKKSVPGGGKKREAPHGDSKERQGRGRGRKGAAEDAERVVSAAKGPTACGADQRPEASSKDLRRGSARSRARPSKQHPPPSPRRPRSPAGAQKAQRRGETPPAPEPAPSSAASPDGEPGVVRAPQARQRTPERQEEPLEEPRRGPEQSQQVTNTLNTHTHFRSTQTAMVTHTHTHR